MIISLWDKMSKLPWLELSNIVIFIILAYWLYPENAGLFILIFFFTIASRANLAFHTMDIELHSLILLFMVMIYGPWPVLLIGLFSSFPTLKLSLYIGLYSPVLTLADVIWIIIITGGALLIPWTNYILYGIILLAIADGMRNFFKSIVLHEFFIKYILMSMLYIVVNYLILTNFGARIIMWLGGSI